MFNTRDTAKAPRPKSLSTPASRPSNKRKPKNQAASTKYLRTFWEQDKEVVK